MEAFCQEIDVVKAESAQCRKEREELQWDLIEARQKLVKLKQYSKSINIEIQGLLLIEKEILEQTAENIAKSLGTNIYENDIDVAHYVLSEDRKKIKCDRSFLHKNSVRQHASSG